MIVKTSHLALAAVVLPTMAGLPPAPYHVQIAVQALCEDVASATVAELAAVASYLAELAAHPDLPWEVRDCILAVRASLLERRIRNHHSRRSSRSSDRSHGRGHASGSGSVTATMQVQVV